VVKAGDIVKVKVLEVDVARKRIALTRRLDDAPAPVAKHGRDASRDHGPREGRRGNAPKPAAPPANNALAEAFARARRG
jgi:uncharacterized protein